MSPGRSAVEQSTTTTRGFFCTRDDGTSVRNSLSNCLISFLVNGPWLKRVTFFPMALKISRHASCENIQSPSGLEWPNTAMFSAAFNASMSCAGNGV